MKMHVTTREGAHHELPFKPNLTVMEVVRDSGVGDIAALCGGNCSCATCHVYVDNAYLDAFPPMSDDENSLLGGSNHRKGQSRLSCQLILTDALDGLRLEVAPED